MEGNADMNSDNQNLINNLKEKYFFCSNISRWISDMNETLFKNPLTECGIVSYKLMGECHLPPSSFPFIELSHDEDALRIIDAAEEPQINSNVKVEKPNTEEQEITGPTLIDKLGVDCLIEIFSYLPLEQRLVIEDVCIHWREVSKKAWSNIRELHVCSLTEFSYIEYFTHSEFVEKLLMRCGVYLRTLKLDSVCSSQMLKVIGEYCHNLTTIYLAFTRSDAEHFDELSKMKKLQSFTTNGFLYSGCLMNCFINLPKIIKSINIGYLDTDDDVKLPAAKIFEEFTELKSLKLEEFIYEKDLMEVISRKKTITEFCVKNIGYEIDLKLLANMSNLERLDLSDLDAVNDDFLRCISMKCQKLKYLDVSSCDNLSDEGVRELRNLNNLEVLIINHMEDSVTDLSLGQLRGIKKLDCQNCWKVKDDGIMQLLKNCPDLEELNVMGTSISKKTLQLAIRVTKDRKNGVILSLIVDIRILRFDMHNENYSPFLEINEPSKERNHNHSECEHMIIDDLEYEKYHLLAKKEY